VADSLVIGAAFLLAYFLRANIQGYPSAILDSLHKLPPLRDYLWVMMIVIPIWIVSLSQAGIYKEIVGGKIIKNIKYLTLQDKGSILVV